MSVLDVKSLTNSELKEQLLKHGVRSGPILPTTRKVYEKKLLQMLDQGPLVPQVKQNGTGDVDQYSDSEEEGLHRDNGTAVKSDEVTSPANNTSSFSHSKTSDCHKEDVLTELFPHDTQPPLGMSATRRRPIKGAAGRPIQFKYDDIAAQAKLMEQVRMEVDKKTAPPRLLTMPLQIAVFAIVAFFVLVYFTMESNPDNPFTLFVENGEMHQAP